MSTTGLFGNILKPTTHIAYEQRKCDEPFAPIQEYKKEWGDAFTTAPKVRLNLFFFLYSSSSSSSSSSPWVAVVVVVMRMLLLIFVWCRLSPRCILFNHYLSISTQINHPPLVIIHNNFPCWHAHDELRVNCHHCNCFSPTHQKREHKFYAGEHKVCT